MTGKRNGNQQYQRSEREMVVEEEREKYRLENVNINELNSSGSQR